MTTTTAPDRTEAADYYFTYIDQVADGDIRVVLKAQLAETLALLDDISEEQSLIRYAPGKWSIRQLVSHVNVDEVRAVRVATQAFFQIFRLTFRQSTSAIT